MDSLNDIRTYCLESMQRIFGADVRRIAHAFSVLEYSERLLEQEEGDAYVVIPAAILHDIGILEAEHKHQSNAGNFQELEGPPIAQRILAGTDLPVKTVEHICKIIANHHSARDIDTPEFRIIWDADWLVNLPDETDISDQEGTIRRIERIFKTDTGNGIARSLYLSAKK